MFNSIVLNHDPVAALGIDAVGRPSNQEEVLDPAQPMRRQTVVGTRDQVKDGDNYYDSKNGNNPGPSSASGWVGGWLVLVQVVVFGLVGFCLLVWWYLRESS